MSELCLPSTSKTRFSSLLKSDIFLFCSFLLAHPLYFLYFIFFSPYILKLLSFLSPLFITTSLFLLAFLTISPSFIHDKVSGQSSEIKVSFLVETYHAIIKRLRSKIDDQEEESLRLEDFEVFRIVFDIHDDANVSQIEVLEAELSENSFQESVEAPVLSYFGHQDLDGCAELQSNWGAMEEEKKLLGSFWQESDGKMTSSVERKKIEPFCTEANKAIEEKQKEEKSVVSNGSEAVGNKIRHNSVVGKDNGREREYKSKLLKAHSHSIGASADYANDKAFDYSLRIQSSPSLDYSYGSMRKEKEWKRTLACKLFEERNKADENSEGMDLLWETYEMESSKNRANVKKNDSKKKKSKKKYEIKEEEIDDRLQGSEEDEADGQLCCLQALKFSTGKMNLGVGRPNLVKISKAIKGIGWLHNLSRHSKKVHNGDRY